MRQALRSAIACAPGLGTPSRRQQARTRRRPCGPLAGLRVGRGGYLLAAALGVRFGSIALNAAPTADGWGIAGRFEGNAVGSAVGSPEGIGIAATWGNPETAGRALGGATVMGPPSARAATAAPRPPSGSLIGFAAACGGGAATGAAAVVVAAAGGVGVGACAGAAGADATAGALAAGVGNGEGASSDLLHPTAMIEGTTASATAATTKGLSMGRSLTHLPPEVQTETPHGPRPAGAC